MYKRFFCLLLCLTSCMAMTACGTSETTVETEPEVPATSTDETETESPFLPDSLPALDFGGTAVNILYRDDVTDSFYVPEQTGEIVDDAVYMSNLTVEERLGVDICLIPMAGSANTDRAPYIAAITNSVMTGDNAYDLCGVLTYCIPELIQKNVLLNLLDVEHLDFDKPWWSSSLTELATVGDKLFFASGDISLELMQRTFCMLFNTDLATELGTEDIYALVSEGGWTLDKMQEIGSLAYSDLNGNGTADADDRFGVVVNDFNHISGFIGSLDIQFTTKSETDGRQHFNGAAEHNIDAIVDIVRVFNENNGLFYQKASDANPEAVAANHDVYRTMFKGDRLLFVTTEFMQIDQVYRDMESVFGVIPYPKYDEAQKDYYSLARNVYSSFVIPKTCENTEMVGALMEAVASQNYRDVAPVYFETALKVKYSHDNATSQMYDLIKNGMRFNFAYTYNAVTDHIANVFCDLVSNNDQNWASKCASVETKLETALQKFYDDVESAN